MAEKFVKILAFTALSAGKVLAAVDHGRNALHKEDIRHNIDVSSLELNVDASSTYNHNFMALMESPCRPEYDGYFGATYGEPVQIQYGFQLETHPLASIMDLLDVVEDRVVDSILSNAFPSMCAYRRRQLSRRLFAASGYRFLKFQEVEKCEPTEGPVNFCGIFVGHVYVYGKDVNDAALETLSLIDQIVNTDSPTVLHPEIVKISSADPYFMVDGGDPTVLMVDDGVDIASIGWAGLGIASLLMVALFWWFCIRNDKQGDTALSNKKGRRSKRTWTRYFRRQQRRQEYNPEDKSLKPSFEPEAVAFGGGERLLLTDGRPVLIDFDKTYSDQTYADQTLSMSATMTTMEPRSQANIV